MAVIKNMDPQRRKDTEFSLCLVNKTKRNISGTHRILQCSIEMNNVSATEFHGLSALKQGAI
jgi:hypothetical protein